MAQLNIFASTGKRTSCILKQAPLLTHVHEAEQRARLRVVVLIDSMVPISRVATSCQRGLLQMRLVGPLAGSIRLIAYCPALIAVHSHSPVTVVIVERALGCVYRDLVRIHTQPVTLRVAVTKQTSLQHLVRREPDAGHYVCGRECRLLYLRKVVFRISIQFQHAHINQRVALVWPDFGEVKGIEIALVSMFFCHQLNGELPTRIVTAFDSGDEVALRAFTILSHDILSFLVAEIPDALKALEVKLDPRAFICCIYEAERVTAKSVHEPITVRQSAITHDIGDLMKRLRK
ncbi:hypothetical protein ASE28_17435 [Acidovorax sp. Root219]|nr:hypothetical protein ASE28_17435 [Acidovorax sp. Root219]